MPTHVKLTGDKRFEKNLRQAVLDVKTAAAAGLYLGANNLAVFSAERTPVDTGVLKGSTYATLPHEVGDKITCEVGVGGPAAKYALEVHEEDRPHKTGEAHFLQNAFNNHGREVLKQVHSFTRQFVSTGSMPSIPSGVVPQTPNEGPKS